MPCEQRDEPLLHVAVEAADRRVDLASAKLLRSPERVVPEVARELRESGASGPAGRGPWQVDERLRETNLVVQQAIATLGGDDRLGQRRELSPGGRLEQREIHVLPAFVEYAPLDTVAERRRLQEPGPGRRTPRPARVVGEDSRVVDEESDVEVGPPVRGASDRACEPTTSAARTSSRARAQSATAAARRSMRVFTLRRSFSSTSTTFSLTPLRESSPTAARASRAPSIDLVYTPGSGPLCGTARASISSRRSSGVTSGQSTGSTMHVSCLAALSPAITPWTGARSSAPSSSTGNGRSSASSAFPTAKPPRRPHRAPATPSRRASRPGTARALSASGTARRHHRRGAPRRR